MGYLVCDTCEGYYKIKQGESATDFLKTCQCGGNLIYSLNPHLTKKREKSKEKKSFTLDLRIVRLVLGVLIVLVPNLLYYNTENYFLFAFYGIPCVAAGFITSILTDDDVKEGVLNGARVGLFSGICYLFIVIFMLLVYKVNLAAITNNLISNIGIFVTSMFVLIIFTAVGGFIGSNARNLLVKRVDRRKVQEKRVKDMTIDLPEGEETLDEETQYHNEMVKLGFKQVEAINNGEHIFKELLSGSISDEDAINQLKDDQKIVFDVLIEMNNISPPEKYKDYHGLKIAAARDICRTFEVMDGLVTSDENKIHKTDDLVESSTTKINNAINELNKAMLDEEFIKFPEN